MLDYIIFGVFITLAIVGVYIAFKSKDKNTLDINCVDEPIDYLIND
jgi:hypothetical protein